MSVSVYECAHTHPTHMSSLTHRNEEVVVPSLSPSEEWFLCARTKIHIGFLPFAPCWYLWRCSRIALGLESKDLSRQITQLSHFWFWENTACLDLTRRLWGYHERARVMVHCNPKAGCNLLSYLSYLWNVSYLYCSTWLKYSYLIGPLSPAQFGETSLGVPRYHDT